MIAPVEEYKTCPHCGKKLSVKAVTERLQKKAVKCPGCKKLILPEVRVF